MLKVITLGAPAVALLVLAGLDWLENPAGPPKAWAVISAFVALVLLMGLWASLFGAPETESGEGGDQ